MSTPKPEVPHYDHGTEVISTAAFDSTKDGAYIAMRLTTVSGEHDFAISTLGVAVFLSHFLDEMQEAIAKMLPADAADLTTIHGSPIHVRAMRLLKNNKTHEDTLVVDLGPLRLGFVLPPGAAENLPRSIQ